MKHNVSKNLINCFMLVNKRYVFITVLSIQLLLLFFSIPALSSGLIMIDETNSTVTYTLTKFGIPFKKKPLPTSGTMKLLIKKDTISNKNIFFLEDLDLKVTFTSQNPIFRTAINYDKYPFFTFMTDLKEPIKLVDGSKVIISGFIDFHDVIKNVKVGLKTDIKENIILLNGNFAIKMTDFGISLPKILLLFVDDSIKTKIQIESSHLDI